MSVLDKSKNADSGQSQDTCCDAEQDDSTTAKVVVGQHDKDVGRDLDRKQDAGDGESIAEADLAEED